MKTYDMHSEPNIVSVTSEMAWPDVENPTEFYCSGIDVSGAAWAYKEDRSEGIVRSGFQRILNKAQLDQANKMMTVSMSEWPADLMDMCREECRKVGMCGEVLYSCVEKWILQKEYGA